jgi:hypothetical protein
LVETGQRTNENIGNSSFKGTLKMSEEDRNFRLIGIYNDSLKASHSPEDAAKTSKGATKGHFASKTGRFLEASQAKVHSDPTSVMLTSTFKSSGHLLVDVLAH